LLYQRAKIEEIMAGKSGAEARIERLTWGLLVLIFAVLYVSDTIAASIPNWLVPLAGAVILLGSGVYQNTRRWRVSPVTWIGGMLLLLFAAIAFYVNPNREFIVESLIVTMVVILFGTFAGET
jgi:carbon starvation protein CstA